MSSHLDQLLAHVENLEADLRSYRAEYHALTQFIFYIFETLTAEQKTHVISNLEMVKARYDRRPPDVRDEREDPEAHLGRILYAVSAVPPSH